MELVNFNDKHLAPAATLHPISLSYKPTKSAKISVKPYPQPRAQRIGTSFLWRFQRLESAFGTVKLTIHN
jgi:hypothetical protein